MNYRNILLSALLTLTSGYAPSALGMQPESSQQQVLNQKLLKACKNGSLKDMRAILAEGADVNSKDGREGSGPIHAACYNGYELMTKLLIKHGVDVEATDRHQCRPLHFACQEGHYDIVKMLLDPNLKQKVDIEALTENNETALHLACANNRLNVVRLLIEKKANIEALTKYNETPLYLACRNNHINVVEFLIKQKAKVNALGLDNYTPLHIACLNGHTKIVNYLTRHGADVNAQDLHQTTPLHIACFKGPLDSVKSLIKTPGIKINAQNEPMHTPLHSAVLGDHRAIVALLLTSGADINLKTKDGCIALDWAYDRDREAVINVFAQHGISIITDEQADANMRAFFAELDKEAQQKQSKAEKNRKKKKKLQEKKLREKQAEADGKNESGDPEATNVAIVPNDTVQVVVEAPIAAITPPIATPVLAPTKSLQQPVKSIRPQQAPNVPAPVAQPANANNGYVVGHHEKFKWPKSLNAAQQKIMLDHLRQLKKWPTTTGLDISLLKGQHGVLRLRVGGHRVLFSVDEASRRIIIHEIALRKSVYKNMKNMTGKTK